MTVHIIGWAIIHSVWQVGLLAAGAALAFFICRRSAPAVRYAVGLGFLLLMAGLPVATAWRMGSISPAAPEFPPTAASEGNLPPIGFSRGSKDAGAMASTASGPGSATGSFDVETLGPAPTLAATVGRTMPWIVAVWLIGLLLTSLHMIGGVARTLRITRVGVTPAAANLHTRVRSIARRIGVRNQIRVLESIRVNVPLVVGALRPVIVVPASLVTGLTPLQLDMLLAHELAHVRRHDFVVNLVQTVVETLLFYHPGARWLSERIRDERESCCDDIAVAACGRDPASYTEALLVLEESRTAGFGFAAAATGGSLLRRARRLMGGTPPHVELGPHWIAGVITISAALLTGREATGSMIQASLTPSPVIRAGEPDTTRSERTRPDPSKAGPASVLRSPAGGSLSDRWRWAEQQSRSMQRGTYWIGYLVAGDEAGKSRYYSDDIPVRIGRDSFFSGHMNLGKGDLSDFTFSGVPLAPIAGTHSQYSTAIFLLMNDGAMGRKIDRVHVGSFGLPVYFAARPVIWLDSATDAESVNMIRSLTSRARTNDIRNDLVGAVGVHRSSSIVVPILVGLLESGSEPDGARREAAEWLGKQRDPRSFGALSHAVRTDRSSEVREAAIEAFGHMESSSATDSLMAFATTIGSADQQRAAVDALGHRTDPRAIEYLTRIVQGRGESQLKSEAVEALANIPDGRGFTVVIDLARNDPSPDVRRQAVEVQDPRVISILRDLANSSASHQVQMEAVESLEDTADDAAAFAVLRSISRSHPNAEVRKKALEILSESRENRERTADTPFPGRPAASTDHGSGVVRSHDSTGPGTSVNKG